MWWINSIIKKLCVSCWTAYILLCTFSKISLHEEYVLQPNCILQGFLIIYRLRCCCSDGRSQNWYHSYGVYRNDKSTECYLMLRFSKSSLVSLRSYRGWLHTLIRLSASFIFPLTFFSVTNFIRQLLRKMRLIHSAFHCFIVRRMFVIPWLFVIRLQISHDRSNWSPSFSTTTFNTITDIHSHKAMETID